MKTINLRTFHALAVIALVFAYVGIIYKLFDTGWVNNVTTTTLFVTIFILSIIGLLLWNIIAHFFDSQKETKK